MDAYGNAAEQNAVERVSAILADGYGFSRGVAERARSLFGDEWENEFCALVERVFKEPQRLTAALQGYSRFAFDSMRRQKRFEKTRRYDNSSYAQAVKNVYGNRQHMLEQYLPGLLLSHYFWPHHYRQLRYFQDFFVAAIAQHHPARFVEVGVGTGIYSRRLLQLLPRASGVGYDISAASKTFAEEHIASYGFAQRYSVLLNDIMREPPDETTDCLICVEVLEHLEDPVAFLKALRALLRGGGKAFITAALNAANEDHIFLYENAEQVLVQFAAAGFSVEQYYLANAYQPETPDLPVPAVAAFIVT